MSSKEEIEQEVQNKLELVQQTMVKDCQWQIDYHKRKLEEETQKMEVLMKIIKTK